MCILPLTHIGKRQLYNLQLTDQNHFKILKLLNNAGISNSEKDISLPCHCVSKLYIKCYTKVLSMQQTKITLVLLKDVLKRYLKHSLKEIHIEPEQGN